MITLAFNFVQTSGNNHIINLKSNSHGIIGKSQIKGI